VITSKGVSCGQTRSIHTQPITERPKTRPGLRMPVLPSMSGLMSSIRNRQAVDPASGPERRISSQTTVITVARLWCEVGFWRLIDTLDKYGLPASVLLNADVCTIIRRSMNGTAA